MGESEILRLSQQITELTAENARRITELTAENAQLKVANRLLTASLESERLQRGCIGIVATVMTAIGGGFVSLYTDWRRWFFGSLLLVGCSYFVYNSLINLSAEVRDHGISGFLKRVWSGWQDGAPG